MIQPSRIWRRWIACLTLGIGLPQCIEFARADELPPSPAEREFVSDLAGSSLFNADQPIADEDVVGASAMVPPPPWQPPPPKPKPGKPKPPPAKPAPYKNTYFDNDFSYKKDPKHEYVFGEELKDMKTEIFGEQLTISTGGEIRHRFMNEDNRLRAASAPGARDDHHLWRWRHYLDTKIGDDFRIYAEMIHADQFGNDLPQQFIDVNRWDIQNLFVDVNLFEIGDKKQVLRYGRQELIFGKQRVMSTLDWANTRRNWEGFRYLGGSGDWKWDAFAVRPLNTIAQFAPPTQYDNEWDQPDHQTWLSGVYTQYNGIKNTQAEFYWFWKNQDEAVATRADGYRHTFGTQWSHVKPIKDCNDNVVRAWDFNGEAAWQFGSDNDDDVNAGMVTGIVGHTWKEVTWSPRLSGLFYYSTGDRDPNDGRNSTFDTLYPLGHAYWALSDNVAGQNLTTYSAQVDVKPTKKLNCFASYHWFNLTSGNDFLYNIGQARFGGAANPGSNDVGQACDLIARWNYNANFDVDVGYSWFWYGKYVDLVSKRDDSTQLYIQTSFRY